MDDIDEIDDDGVYFGGRYISFKTLESLLRQIAMMAEIGDIKVPDELRDYIR